MEKPNSCASGGLLRINSRTMARASFVTRGEGAGVFLRLYLRSLMSFMRIS
ncbi:GSCOCG00008150001-RA-CDS [Cotesia congregata]|nr:GSCOCG00008150001-RA-CDS [Cotesia congregata]